MWSGTGSTKLYSSTGVLLECWHTIRDIVGAKLHLHAVRGLQYILHDSSYNRQLYQTWFLDEDRYSRWGSNTNYVEETWCYLAATTTAGSYDVFISVWLASNIYWREKKLVIDDLDFTYLQTSHVSCSYATLLLTRLPLNHITAQERCAKPRPDPESALHLHPSSRIGSPCTSFSSSLQILQTYIYILISNLFRRSTRSKLKTRTMECSSLTIEI